MAEVRRRFAVAAAALLLAGCWAPSGGGANGAPTVAAAGRRTLHYAPNDNFGPRGRYLLQRFGYTLADVSSPSELRALPPGVKGLVYLGMCGGNTARFRSAVASFQPVGRVYAYYLTDVPDPHKCPAAHLAAETRFIHRRIAHSVTFVELRNLASSKHPDYRSAYTRPSTGIDLFGVSPYPCRTELHGCDLSMVARYMRAVRRAGIRLRQLVPVFQAFGGGGWRDDGGGHYMLPTARQARALLCRWHQLVPDPAFDYAYSWGVQWHDSTLATASPALRHVFAAHNAGAHC